MAVTRQSVLGLEKVVTKLRNLVTARRTAKATVAAGYATPYALYVHEDLAINRRSGQPKFLEQPTREEEPKVKEIVYRSMAEGRTLGQALVKAANHIMDVSKKMVPVDTGRLKRSNFVIVEEGSAN